MQERNRYKYGIEINYNLPKTNLKRIRIVMENEFLIEIGGITRCRGEYGDEFYTLIRNAGYYIKESEDVYCCPYAYLSREGTEKKDNIYRGVPLL